MKRSNIDLFIPTYTRSGSCDLPQIEDMSKIEKYFPKTGGCCGPKMTLRANKVDLFPSIVEIKQLICIHTFDIFIQL